MKLPISTLLAVAVLAALPAGPLGRSQAGAGERGAQQMSSGRQVITIGAASSAPLSPAVKAGGFIYTAGALSPDGDIRTQTAATLDRLAKVLEAAGSDLAHAVKAHVYIKRAEDFAAMNEVYGQRWKADPPARTTIVADLASPTALVEIAMVAVPKGADRRIVHPEGWAKSTNPYSYGVRSGDTLYLAGLIARNGRDTTPAGGDMTAQTRVAMDNGAAILRAAGMGLEDVVSSRVYITDTTKFQEMNTAYRTYFPTAPPARATVRADLTGPQYLVEITMVAVKGPAREPIATPGPDGKAGTPNPNLSSAIRVGNRLFLSGALGNTEATKADAAAQTTETLARLQRTLAAGGFAPSDVVESLVYLTDLAHFDAMNRVYRGLFAKDFPARTTARTGLVAADGLVEIMMVAAR
jgi:enamine deaminase RidA (YjgF/YER057c/UK114 family)